jgi:tetratricopeptide (TPR) repeat protein
MAAIVLSLLLLAADGTRHDADLLFESHRFEEAGKAYLTLLRADPTNVELLEATGNSLLAAGGARQAIPFFQRVLTLSPGNVQAARQLAGAFAEINEFGQAQHLLDQLTRSNPSDAMSWYGLGMLMFRNGYYSAAIDNLDRAVTLGLTGPEAAVYRNRAETSRAIALLEAGRTDEAAKAIADALGRPENASNLDLLLSVVRLNYEAGRYGDAMKEADVALGVNPRNAAVHFWRALILQQQSHIPEATTEAERSRELDPGSPAPRSLLVRLYQRSGRSDDAARETQWLHENEAKAGEPHQ